MIKKGVFKNLVLGKIDLQLERRYLDNRTRKKILELAVPCLTQFLSLNFSYIFADFVCI